MKCEGFWPKKVPITLKIHIQPRSGLSPEAAGVKAVLAVAAAPRGRHINPAADAVGELTDRVQPRITAVAVEVVKVGFRQGDIQPLERPHQTDGENPELGRGIAFETGTTAESGIIGEFRLKGSGLALLVGVTGFPTGAGAESAFPMAAVVLPCGALEISVQVADAMGNIKPRPALLTLGQIT